MSKRKATEWPRSSVQFIVLHLLPIVVSSLKCPSDYNGLSGDVVTRGDPRFPLDKLNWQEFIRRDPCAIVHAATSTDVSHAIQWARTHGVPFRARSGRHDYENYSTLDDGLVVDVGRMKRVYVDEKRGRGVFGPGAKLFDVYDAVSSKGYGLAAGSCATVGIGGFALGAGYGLMSRKYGMAVDQLTRLEVVTSTGAIVNASLDENADLFWALRGAGHGSFGIVTELEFKLFPKPDNYTYFNLAWDDVNKTAAFNVFDTWQRSIPTWPDELTGQFQFFNGGLPGTVTVHVVGLFEGVRRDAEAAIATVLSVMEPSREEWRSFDYLGAMVWCAGCPSRDSCLEKTALNPNPKGQTQFKCKSRYVKQGKPMDRGGIDVLADWMGPKYPEDSGLVGYLLVDSYGGRINQVPSNATSFPHRDMLYSVQFVADWTKRPSDAEVALSWISGMYEAVAPFMAASAYVNYVDSELSNWLSMYYGNNVHELMDVKQNWDPDNVFDYPQSIPLQANRAFGRDY